jgi:hypothetical protein
VAKQNVTWRPKPSYESMTVLKLLPDGILAWRGRTPVGQEKDWVLSGSATAEGGVGRVPRAVNEKALWLEAGSSAIYGNSEVFHAGR